MPPENRKKKRKRFNFTFRRHRKTKNSKKNSDKKSGQESADSNIEILVNPAGIFENIESNNDILPSTFDKRHFCTIATKEYLIKVVALSMSLERNSTNYHLWICCMDDTTLSLLLKMNLKDVTAFPVKDIESAELLAVKKKRKMNEYCWTLKAPLFQHILNMPGVNEAIYCDGDIFFFSNPEIIFKDWGNSSIYLCPQRDKVWVHDMYGKYQAGLIGFRMDANGLDALNWWRTKCIEWCFSNYDPDNSRFGDQKYLDSLPSLFQSVKISNNFGIDAAPWNTIYNNNYEIYTSSDDLIIQKDKLVAFHFACMQIFNDDEFDLWALMNLEMKGIVKTKIYLPYIEALRKAIGLINSFDNEDASIFFSSINPMEAKTYYKYSPLRTYMDEFDNFFNFCTIISNEYLIKGLALYHSLRTKLDNFHLWVCCVENEAYSALKKMNLKNMTVIHVKEAEDSELLQIKSDRSLTEYCMTIKPSLILYLLNSSGLDSIMYCDADIYFFSDPGPIINLWKDHSMFMCSQRDTDSFQKIHGEFQSGFLGFRHDKYSFDILNWWRKKCIDWCHIYPEPENERWGSQKYLDKIPLFFESVKLIDNHGIGAAPWNIVNNKLNVSRVNNKIFIKKHELIAYHFGTFGIINKNEFDLWRRRPIDIDGGLLDYIYRPYLKVISGIIDKLEVLPYINIDNFLTVAIRRNFKNYFRY